MDTQYRRIRAPRTTNSPAVAMASKRRGFTLIEMLISVALVLLMMVLFAEIFGLASNAMTLQQAIADGDQQVRSFTTVMRSDLQKRTFRTVVPFDADIRETPELAAVPFADRQGYMYISLNDPNSATDNVLQFTVRSTILAENGDDTAYFGRGSGLVQRTDDGTNFLNPVDAASNVRANSQQPEHDDGELANNFTAASTAAEIAYFMRGGRLYRRVALIRDPLAATGTNSPQPRLTWDTISNQPFPIPAELLRHIGPSGTAADAQTVGGQYLRFNPDPATGWNFSDDYWLDFDHSAFMAFNTTVGTIDGASMVGLSSLDNSQSQSIALTLAPALSSGVFNGNPRCRRFGFDQETGISREFSHASPTASGYFFLGRYTLEEMSHPNFNFPQNLAIDSSGTTIGDPMSYADYPGAADAGLFPNGVVDDFEGGTRRGQDLLMSNVHAFEIDIWDDRLGRFVQLGHQESLGGELGDYHRSRNQQLLAGLVSVPGDSTEWNTGQYTNWTGRIFDTWHPMADLDGDTATTTDRVPAPYRPMIYYPPGSPNGPYASRGRYEPSTPGSPVNYAVGDVVFPATFTTAAGYAPESAPKDHSFYYLCVEAGTAPNTEDADGSGTLDPSEDLNCNGLLDPAEDINMNGILDPGEDTNMNGVLDPAEDTNMNGVLDQGEDTIICNGIIDTGEPVWPTIHRAYVERQTPGSNEPRWIAVRNVRPLRAIRVRVRFFHESSGRMRQVSIVHSLADEGF